jgi:hypothetical protein
MPTLLTVLLCAILLQETPVPSTGLETKPVTIEAVRIEGKSRFSQRSILALGALKIGQALDEKGVRAACARMNASGLLTNVEYAYEAYPDREGVTLVLTPHDQLPLIPAKIQIKGVEEEDVWNYLESVDPLFTRELPRSVAALHLYERFINKYVDKQSRTERAIDEVQGTEDHPTLILFKAVQPKTAR